MAYSISRRMYGFWLLKGMGLVSGLWIDSELAATSLNVVCRCWRKSTISKMWIYLDYWWCWGSNWWGHFHFVWVGWVISSTPGCAVWEATDPLEASIQESANESNDQCFCRTMGLLGEYHTCRSIIFIAFSGRPIRWFLYFSSSLNIYCCIIMVLLTLLCVQEVLVLTLSVHLFLLLAIQVEVVGHGLAHI